MSRKRQRDWGDSGGWQISRRRNHGSYVSHEEDSPGFQQQPDSIYERPPMEKHLSAEGNRISSLRIEDEEDPADCCQMLLYLAVFAVVGAVVLQFLVIAARR